MQLDIDALSEPFKLIQSSNGLVLLQSQASERFIILDELRDTEELHEDEIYVRSEAAERLEQRIVEGNDVFIATQEMGELLFKQRVIERRNAETDEDRAYRQYLFEMRDKIGADFLDYAMPREEYSAQQTSEPAAEPAQTNQPEDLPTYDIHTTYHNDKLYEKNTPYNLRARPQFVCWKYEWGGGKWKKLPYNPNTGKPARSNSPQTWSDFDTACKAVDKYNLDGVGIMFSKGLMGIDIDHCINENGEISDSAREIINTVNSYTELSPSGTGIHILAFGELPGQRTRTGDFEMYCKGRFFTLTGKPFENVFRKIPKASDTADGIKLMYEKYINVKRDFVSTNMPAPDTQLTFSDEKVLELCRKSRNADKFNDLWNGQITYYKHQDGTPDLSLHDAALCGMIAYYTDDEFQIDRLFRQSKLYRPKWDEYRGDMTYGQKTIRNILSNASRPRYNPKYFYETQIKPKFNKENQDSEWTTIKLSDDNFVQDYQRSKNFKITQGELAGATFFYPNSLITKAEDGYHLKVKSDFTFKLRPKGSQTDIELNCNELRQAIAGQPLNKKPKTAEMQTPALQANKQIEAE